MGMDIDYSSRSSQGCFRTDRDETLTLAPLDGGDGGGMMKWRWERGGGRRRGEEGGVGGIDEGADELG